MGKPPVLDDINVLYQALENADKAGDVEGARELTQYILKQEDMAKDPERLSISEKLSPELAGITGAATGAGLKTAQLGLQMPFKVGERFGQGFASKMPNFVPPSTPVPLPIIQGTGAAHWLESMTGTNIPGGQMNKTSMDVGNRLASIVQPGGEFAGGELKGSIALPPDIRARNPKVPTAPKPSLVSRAISAPMRGLEKVGSAVAPYASAVGKFLNPVVALGGAGYAGADMYNRHQVGDTTGEILSGIGALGSLASMAPHPIIKGAGMGVGLSAEAINAYRDKLRRGEIVHGGAQQNVDASGNAYATGGLVHLAEGRLTGKSDSPSGMQAGLQYLEELLRAIKNPEKTPVVPVPNRWFSQPDKFPQVQGLVEKALTHSGQPREAFHSGAFIDPRTGEVLDRRIYNNLGVVIDPQTGKPMMSVGNQAGIEVLDPKTGSYTKSNLVRKNLFTPTGGDPLLNRLPFIATIENKGVHHYGLGTQYATPTELHNTMKGENPTLRPRSRGEVFGMGDVVGQARIGGRGEPKNIYEKLFVAPKGSDVPGVRLGTTGGGGGGYINPVNPLMGSGLTPFGMKTGGKVKKK